MRKASVLLGSIAGVTIVWGIVFVRVPTYVAQSQPWKAYTLPLFNDLQFVKPSRGFIGGQGVILFSQNGGSMWNVAYNGPTNVESFDLLNNRGGWALGRSSRW